MNKVIADYGKEVRKEMEEILSYWNNYTVDLVNGGFHGKIDNDNQVGLTAPKGSVLHSRILWTFSAAYNLTGNPRYLEPAERAFQYLRDFFVDPEFGGVYWTVTHTGAPLDTKKQVYAIAFCVYGLSEYYISTSDEEVKRLATSLYHSITSHSYDYFNGGYIEALTRDWKEAGDLRLSGKDANEKKSMNTHLHVLEAFTNLYRIWKTDELRQRIAELIGIFTEYIIDAGTNHLRLFFDETWNSKSGIISYGHDIEAAWLVQEAAEIIEDPVLTGKMKGYSVKLADAASRGLDADGGLWYEYDGLLVKEKHWWPNAEAMVGFFHVWQITGEESYLKKSLNSWDFIKQHLINREKGEWYWGVKEDYTVMPDQDKVGLWKCPYHNTRACMEIIKRI